MGIRGVLKSMKPKEVQIDEHRRNMGKPSHEEGGHDESNWLVAYADMMTLLCAFFIMLFSMATLDKHKFENVRKEVSDHFQGEYSEPSKGLGKFVTQILQESGIDKQTVIERDALGVAITFQSTVFFDTLSATLRDDGRAILAKLAAGVIKNASEEKKTYQVVVEGHTDSRPVLSGTFPSNWELSSSRATQVVRLFVDHGFSPENIVPIGYADTRPLVEDRNELGKYLESSLAQNRRVVIRVSEIPAH